MVSTKAIAIANRTPGEIIKDAKKDYIHWKHATFGKKPEETQQDTEYRERLQKILDEFDLLKAHWSAANTFFTESNRFMIQNEVLAQCMRDVVKEDETSEYFFGTAYENLLPAVGINEQSSQHRAKVHSELQAQIKQLTMQVEHVQSLEKEREFHMIEVHHYTTKVEKLSGNPKNYVSKLTADDLKENEELPMSKMSAMDRNSVKMNKVVEAYDEFRERNNLMMMCIERFMEKLKIDLTVRYTKHIQLDHFAIMDSIFRNVDSFFADQIKEGEHAEFEWHKEWRQYEE